MQFKKNAQVYSSDNQDIGRLERVVMDPGTQKVSHIVVRQGLFFTEDKVIPVDYVEQADGDNINLSHHSDSLQKLPKFEAVQHVPIEQQDMEDFQVEVEDGPFYMYWNPPMGAAPYYGIPPVPTQETAPQHPYYVERTTQNIPEGTIALEEGGHVESSDGEHVGNIERIYVDPQTNYATHILISQGFFLRETRWVPTTWFRTVSEDKVYLAVSAATIERMPTSEKA